ncbi:PEP-CTERM sorting domain-containing protein [Coraliomargarita sp. SDUM461004]|uniref:PEP-CTERM sorting domain-containing protein n=1 Tax=Thalassobacterium sedimentorum TaxID=3041258 RepID=A0ABU1AE00_9BACT|nr:PEP-CTERM sorting domain-containing protein [Coraliomargarita sp. SDUM461004]MDQ8192817.1 PEP-CTERM sorting domain-containing protein [Coraliomargarita sp. SDUM461004]
MYIKKNIISLSLAFGFIIPAFAETVIDYDFTDEFAWDTTNSVQVVKDAGFTVNDDADNDDVVFVGGGDHALILAGNTSGRYPIITYDFDDAIVQGNATFVANATGASPHVGQIHFLNASGDLLFGTQLRQDDGLYVYADGVYDGSGGPNLLPSGGSVNAFNSYEFIWSSNTDGTDGVVDVLFNGSSLLESPVGYQVDGVVDSLLLSVGYGSSSSNRYLRVTSMEVHSVPEPGTSALILGVGTLGFACLRRRQAR